MSATPSDEDERINGLGFADRLADCPDVPYTGERGLKLARAADRYLWTRVLCAHIKDHNGRCIPNERAGKMGWFHLRLTREETLDLFSAGEADRVIELIPPADVKPGDSRWSLTSGKMRAEWRLTPEGENLAGLRGGGIRDTFSRLPGVARTAYAIAQVLLGSTALLLVGAAGLTVASKSPEALALLLGGVWALLAAVVFAGYADEHELRKCAEAWPRMQAPEYRKNRFEHLKYPLRSPLPAGFLVLITVGAALLIAHVLLQAEESPRDVPGGWLTAAYVVLGITALIVSSTAWNARKLRRAYRNEYDKRKKQFKPREGPDETFGRRVGRIAQLVLPRF